MLCFWFIRCMSNEFMGFVHEWCLLHIIQNVVRQCLSRFALECVQKRGKWICIFMPMLCGISLVHVRYQIPYVSNSDWMKQDLCLLLLLLFFTYCTVHSLEHVLNRTSESSFVSLRMICKTPIWCNQILIVKHQWSAVNVTSRMMFLMEYS